LAEETLAGDTEETRALEAERRSASGRRRLALVATGLAVSAVVALWMPASLRALLDGVGLAICHQWPAHSFFLGGKQLPLCARCTGTFLGATLSMMALVWRGRTRARNLPPVPILGVLVLFIVVWAADGLNSYLSIFPGLAYLYEPSNLLRLGAGLLNGIALTNLALPVFFLTIWRQTTPEASLRNWRELAGLLMAALVVGALVAWGPDFLFGPVALWSIFGVVALLTVVNTVIVVVILHKEESAESVRDLAGPVLAAFLLTTAMVGGIVWLRIWLRVRFGLPF